MFWKRGLTFLLGYIAVAVLFISLAGELGGAQDWRTASRAPAGLAPDPATTHEAVVQVGAVYALAVQRLGQEPGLDERPTSHWPLTYASKGAGEVSCRAGG